jgi:CO/xanthine dehydrogenase Mo-binding subunit
MTTRRQVLGIGVAASGSLALRGVFFGACGSSLLQAEAADLPVAPKEISFGVYLQIRSDGRILITCPQAEMGQGVHDSLPKILAEELDADWSHVDVTLATGDDRFINPVTKRHRTANSESVMIHFELLRRTGAAAREMLRAAAAQRWNVGVEECRAAESSVTHPPSGRRYRYAELAAEAALLAVPQNPPLKAHTDFKLIGHRVVRKDAVAKVTGRAVFGLDVQQPDMLYAALFRSPATMSRVLDFDRAATLQESGVVDAFGIDDGVAIIAVSTWHALRAAARLQANFDTTPAESVDSAAMQRRLHAALEQGERAQRAAAARGQIYDVEATEAALAAAPLQASWTYEVPFLAHAALEPLTATARVHAGRAELWVPTQQPDRARDVMAEVTGLARESCLLYTTFIGGSFGRKWENDFVRQTMQIAARMAERQPGVAVKLTWSREQDFLHDRFRPAHVARTRVGVTANGEILAMHSRITGISIFSYQRRKLPAGVTDPFVTSSLISDRYAIANKYVDYVETPEPIPVGTWRSVAHSQNGFFAESAIDEIAALCKIDPLALRLRLCAGDVRAQTVLQRAAEKSNWTQSLTAGRGRGISLLTGYGSYCALVIEVTIVDRAVKIERIVAAFDCGLIIDPSQLEAQISGGIIWGLSAALNGEITFAAGAAQQQNFDSAPVLRLADTPPIEVDLLQSDAAPGGAGEASVGGVAPALASAIAAAGGERPRRLPLSALGWTFS